MSQRYIHYGKNGGLAIFDSSDVGMTRMLCAGFLVDEMRSRALEAKAKAEAIAPGTGSYRESFAVSSGVGANSKGKLRAFGKLANTARSAIYVEWGNTNIDPHRVLRRAAGQIDFSRDRYTKKGEGARNGR